MSGGKGSAAESVGEGLGSGLLGGGSGEGVLSFRGGCGVGEERDFIGDGVSEVEEGFAEVGRIVVSFVRVLGTEGDVSTREGELGIGKGSLRDGEELRVDLLQGVNTLLKLDIVGRKLGLY